VADGSVDAGLVTSNARDWDLAAADLVLREAGGLLTDLRGDTPRYNEPDPTHDELAAAPEQLHAAIIAAINRP
jgi:myo-inositol-1(or 4)-monophosphatase